MTVLPMGAEQPPREGRVRHFDVDFAPCSCVGHRFVGLDCIEVYQRPVSTSSDRVFYMLRECQSCGIRWRTETMRRGKPRCKRG